MAAAVAITGERSARCRRPRRVGYPGAAKPFQVLDVRRGRIAQMASRKGVKPCQSEIDRRRGHRKATNVYDRGGIKWARFQVNGREFRGSLIDKQ